LYIAERLFIEKGAFFPEDRLMPPSLVLFERITNEKGKKGIGTKKLLCLSPDLNRGQPDLQSGALPD
jgi:hypothetical protein